MAAAFSAQIRTLVSSVQALASSDVQKKLDSALELLVAAAAVGRPILTCGNGGSAADAQHIAGELVGRFLRDRRALNVRALTVDTSVLTAWANNASYETVFSRQVEAYGQTGGVLMAISTSGNSKNVIAAAHAARDLGMTVVALTGAGGGQLAELADILLDVPSRETPRIQEMHLMLYHYLCEEIERRI
jgi:D-sedoheptulose 7-phosphate isomerase